LKLECIDAARSLATKLGELRVRCFLAHEAKALNVRIELALDLVEQWCGF
jgi:hypothetical protein